MKNLVVEANLMMSRILANDKHGILITPLFAYRIREYEGDDTVAAVSPVHGELYLHPERFPQLPDKEKRFVIYHEAMHLVLGHTTRQENRHQLKWNVAADLEINWILKENGIELMSGVLYEPHFHGWHAERIYEALKDVEFQHGGYVGYVTKDGKTGAGKTIDTHPEYSDAERRAAQMAEQTAAIQVEQAYRQIGVVPVGVTRIIDQLLTPKVTWQQLLLGAVTSQKRDDYSYSHPRRWRLALDRAYFPSLSGTMREVVVIVDTSGSISREELTRFVSEIVELVTMYPTTVLFCDTTVQAVVEDVQDIESVIQNVKGGGGTHFAPAFQWIDEHKDTSVTVILMTDGYNDDAEILVPSCVEQVIVLTTERVPSGLEPDLVIPLKEEVSV